MSVFEYLQSLQVGGDQYIIIPEQTAKKTKSGIVFAEHNKAEQKDQAGTIVARGPGRLPESGTERQPMEFDVGKKVLFNKYAGNDYYIDDDFKRYPAHTELREGLTPVKVLRQDSILHTL